MQSFDREIQSFIFPGNKTTDQNEFYECEKHEHLNQTVGETSLVRLIFWRCCMPKTAINSDVSASEKLRSVISQ